MLVTLNLEAMVRCILSRRATFTENWEGWWKWAQHCQKGFSFSKTSTSLIFTSDEEQVAGELSSTLSYWCVSLQIRSTPFQYTMHMRFNCTNDYYLHTSAAVWRLHLLIRTLLFFYNSYYQENVRFAGNTCKLNSIAEGSRENDSQIRNCLI